MITTTERMPVVLYDPPVFTRETAAATIKDMAERLAKLERWERASAKGERSRSKAKAAAARRNGAKGGRPRKAGK